MLAGFCVDVVFQPVRRRYFPLSYFLTAHFCALLFLMGSFLWYQENDS